MKTSEARGIGDKITAGVHFPGGAGVDWGQLSGGTGWSSDLLARLSILVGTEAIEYVSGYVDEHDRIHGELVVLTRSRIVRAEFSASGSPGRFALDAHVFAVSRSTIARVALESVTPWGADSDEDWPHAVSAVVTTLDDKTFRLPLVSGRASLRQTATAELISTLMTE
jgi:hypothetical protein